MEFYDVVAYPFTAANPAIAFRLQSAPLVRRVAKLRTLGLMGFHAALNKARDISLPMPKRYMALLSALERGHRSYHNMWAVLRGVFGVQMGDKMSSETLCAITDFLAKDSQQWLEAQKEERESVRKAKRQKKAES
jgi:hypothetical protein